MYNIFNGGKAMDFTTKNTNNFKKREWSKKTDGYTFKKLGDLYKEGVRKVQVFGFFFTKSENYGLQPNAICDGYLLNLPKHQGDTISEMLQDDDFYNAINNGECTLEIREYQSNYNKTCYEISYTNTPKTTPATEPAATPATEPTPATQPDIF